MSQCTNHFLDVNYLAKQLYFTLTLSKVFNSEITNESLSRVTICTKCYAVFYNLDNMKEHLNDTHHEHTLFLGLCPMRIACVKCDKVFGCPAALMKSIIYSLPSFPYGSPPVGFMNLGNSCYSNSVLIALSHCYPLVTASSVSSYTYLKVFNIAATANRLFNRVFHAINPKFSPFTQEDAAEFLLHIIDLFSYDSKCKQIFNGSTKTHFICNKCKAHTEIEQEFTVLSIPLSQDGWKGKKANIPSQYIARDYGCSELKFGGLGDGSFGNHVVSFVQHLSVSTLSLEKSLQNLFSPHFEINGNGRLKKKKNEPLSKCEKCHGENQMITTLEKLPEVLVIHLERFGKRWFGLGKMYQSISFPEDDADFSQFMSPNNETGPSLYSLFAVVIHNGFMSSGHYMCYARNFGSNNWFLFNDHEVTKVTREEVLNSQAYILFYQKKPPENVVEIRNRIAKIEVPNWATTPINIFSDPRMWRKSIPTIRMPIDKLRNIEARKKEEKINDDPKNSENSNKNENFDDNIEFIDEVNQVHDYVFEVFNKIDPILKEASIIAGENVERIETEDDVRTRVVSLYPTSKHNTLVTKSSAEKFWDFVAQKGPIPFMIKTDVESLNSQIIGDEVNVLISDISNETQTENSQNIANTNEEQLNKENKENEENEEKNENKENEENKEINVNEDNENQIEEEPELKK